MMDPEDLINETETTETENGAEEFDESELEAGERNAAEETEDAEDADDAEETDDEDEDEGLGRQAQKRIKKLVGQRKDAERRIKELEGELEEARKTGGEDAETFLSAAKTAGVLPSLLTKDLAEAIEGRRKDGMAIKFYEDFLDGDDETLTLGDRELTRRDVRRRVRELRERQETAERRFGQKERDLQKRVKDIFTLGQAAMKAGWKPGAKSAPAKTNKDKPGKGASLKPTIRKGAGSVDYGSIGDADDMEAAILASMEER